MLKCKAVKATFPAEILIHHNIIRYLFRGRAKLSGDGVSVVYEKDDFNRFCLPSFWHYYLNQLGQGVAVEFPVKLHSVLRMSKKCFIMSNSGLEQAPLFLVHKVTITINRKVCDKFSI